MSRRPYYNNDTELTKAIQSDLVKSMNYLNTESKKTLHNSFNRVQVPVKVGGIGTAWDTSIYSMGTEIEYTMQYNPSLLSIEPSNYRHYSPVGSQFRNFADLIEYGQGGYMERFGGYNNPTMRPRPFWKTFINTMNQKLYSELFLKCCKKANIDGIERG